MTTIKILSIDAWADGEHGWTWNNWHKVGECDLSVCGLPAAELIAYMIEEGYLKPSAASRVSVTDDQYNMVIEDNETGEPLYALEYGAVWRIRILDAAAHSSDPARNARAWAAGWTPPGYALYALRVAAYVRYSTLPVDTARESGHIPHHKVA